MKCSGQASPIKAKNRSVVTRAGGSGQHREKAEFLFKFPCLSFNTKVINAAYLHSCYVANK